MKRLVPFLALGLMGCVPPGGLPSPTQVHTSATATLDGQAIALPPAFSGQAPDAQHRTYTFGDPTAAHVTVTFAAVKAFVDVTIGPPDVSVSALDVAIPPDATTLGATQPTVTFSSTGVNLQFTVQATLANGKALVLGAAGVPANPS